MEMVEQDCVQFVQLDVQLVLDGFHLPFMALLEPLQKEPTDDGAKYNGDKGNCHCNLLSSCPGQWIHCD